MNVRLEVPPAIGVVLPRGNFKAQAEAFIKHCQPNLKRYREEFYFWTSGYYCPIADEAFRTKVRRFLDAAKVYSKAKEGTAPVLEPFLPDSHAVSELVDALRGLVQINEHIVAPCWLDGRTEPRPADVISFPNGILDLGTDVLLPPTPDLFTLFATGFDYDPKAPKPKRWLEFLDEIFAGDDAAEQITLLQEVMGCCLTTDNSHQKAFSLTGPARSGKGTIVNTMKALLAEGAMASPTLSSLGQQYGRHALVGKQVAVVSDARISHKTDLAVLAETILSISGGDQQGVQRKFKSDWTGALPVKFWIISNELMKLGDESGVLAKRFVNLITRHSFSDREDKTLFESKLRPELPGIMNWALDGLRRLRALGKFSETSASNETQQQLRRLMSRVTAFADDCITFAPDKDAAKDDVFEAWRSWCVANGIAVGAKNVFSQHLLDAYRGRIKTGKTTSKTPTGEPVKDTKGNPVRVQVYHGMEVKM